MAHGYETDVPISKEYSDHSKGAGKITLGCGALNTNVSVMGCPIPQAL